MRGIPDRSDAMDADPVELRVLGSLLSRLPPEPVYFHAAGRASGWKAHSEERRSRRLLKLWKAFEDATPFWRG